MQEFAQRLTLVYCSNPSVSVEIFSFGQQKVALRFHYVFVPGEDNYLILFT